MENNKTKTAKMPHNVVMEEKSRLNVTGVYDVDSFTDEIIVAVLDNSELVIKGRMLHISKLSVESGELIVDGEITSLTYAQRITSGGFFKKLFK